MGGGEGSANQLAFAYFASPSATMHFATSCSVVLYSEYTSRRSSSFEPGLMNTVKMCAMSAGTVLTLESTLAGMGFPTMTRAVRTAFKQPLKEMPSANDGFSRCP